MFADSKLNADIKEKGFVFSSANSINIGRLVPQIVYYVYAYGQLLKQGVIEAGEFRKYSGCPLCKAHGTACG